MKRRLIPIASTFIIVAMMPQPVPAECMRAMDGSMKCGPGYCAIGKDGTVWCSPFEHGGVVVDLNGIVWGGKGKCAIDVRGQVKCAPFPEGSVRRDPLGEVKAGMGQCQTERPIDPYSRVYCSRVRRGHAHVALDGSVECEGGCMPGADAVPGVPAIKGVPP